MPTSFDSIFFAGPYLVSYCLRSLVLTAPVRGSTPTLFRVPLPLPDTARFQVQKSFVWFRAETDKGIVCSVHPYSATLELFSKSGDLSEEKSEFFHQDIHIMEEHYQGPWDVNFLAEYCWFLKWNAVAAKHRRKSLKRPFIHK